MRKVYLNDLLYFLEEAEKVRLHELQETDPHSRAVVDELIRILESRTLEWAKDSTRALLSYIVCMTLLGRKDDIKEIVIGLRVLRDHDYDPARKTSVRVAAAKLRRRLEEYYAGEGVNDPFEILVPKGGYLPEFHDRGILVWVDEFENWNPDGEDRLLYLALREEVIQALGRRTPAPRWRILGRPEEAPEARYALRGSLVAVNGNLRMNLSLSDLEARVAIAAKTLERRRDDILKLPDEVVSLIIDTLQPDLCQDAPTEPANGSEPISSLR
jgi:TolB-like protein